MTTQRSAWRRVVMVCMALALIATACTGSATVTQTGSNGDGGTAEPTAGVTPDDATPVPLDEPNPTATPEPTAVPAGPPAVTLPAEAFLADAVVALSHDGAFVYAGTSSWWNDPVDCDGAATESLTVVNFADAEAGQVAPVAAGLEQVGGVGQMLVLPNGTAAIMSACGGFDGDRQVWLHRAELAADGRIAELGDRIDLQGPGESLAYLMRWIDDDSVDVRVVVEQDPDDSATWIVERRHISLSTGQVLSVEQFDYFSDDGFSSRGELTTATGTYRVIDDPAGALGCEGFGVAVTLELDTGQDRRLALTQPDRVFSDVTDLQMTPDGYILWTSGCEGFVSAYVGRIQADGLIADAHLIETFEVFGGTYGEFRMYRLTNDGFMHAVGTQFDPDLEVSNPAFLRYDLRADPHFINTADPAPQIDQSPLFASAGGDGTWHVGDTLASDPACGGRTLYGQTAGGFVRAFSAGFELDAIVDVDLGEIQRTSFPDGDYVSRTVVLQTECPGDYEGRQVWFGVESDKIIWGLWLERADVGEVADVLSVRDVFREGSDFVETRIVQVELLDGSVADIELVPLPLDS